MGRIQGTECRDGNTVPGHYRTEDINGRIAWCLHSTKTIVANDNSKESTPALFQGRSFFLRAIPEGRFSA
jgi:hypothetical protein